MHEFYQDADGHAACYCGNYRSVTSYTVVESAMATWAVAHLLPLLNALEANYDDLRRETVGVSS